MNINTYIDHTLLKANSTKEDIKKICDEAKEHNFKAVCINSYYVPYAKDILKDTNVSICTVVGFPLGASPTQVKLLETKLAIESGADEIDMVINIGMALDNDLQSIEDEVRKLSSLCRSHNKILKVILETCYLNKELIFSISQRCVKAGAHFVKTSTGFGTGGATIEDVKTMKSAVGDNCEIKASGGVRDIKAAKEYISLGVTRLGTSSGVKIINGEASDSTY
ncbi:MAG: deoxyribose-phosphate aldolase [Bacteriovoracaceae bacterium]|jgi:deoxyribose-phosphate aldolase|nr:deoxyribose-phosphate aldolase [Bacteriovoracaceae bacterium]